MTEQIIEAVEELVADIMTRIGEAATKRDITAIETLTRAATDLNDVKEKVSSVGARLARLNVDGAHIKSNPQPSISNRGLRELKIEVTDGAIRQNLLTMTEPLRKGLVRADEQFKIESVPSGERFKTVLLASGNKLQERGAISRFYNEAHVRGGDFVLLTEVAPGEWTLRKFSNNHGHL